MQEIVESLYRENEFTKDDFTQRADYTMRADFTNRA